MSVKQKNVTLSETHHVTATHTHTYLFFIVDTLEVKCCYVGALQGFARVLSVAFEDLALQVCTHGIHLVPPVGGGERTRRTE